MSEVNSATQPEVITRCVCRCGCFSVVEPPRVRCEPCIRANDSRAHHLPAHYHAFPPLNCMACGYPGGSKLEHACSTGGTMGNPTPE